MKRTILVLQLAFALAAAHAQTAVQAWVQRYGGPGHRDDVAHAIAVDTNGYVYVTGSAYSGSNSEYATVAYSNTGTPLWTNRYGGQGTGNDIPVAMAVDSFDHVYVTGSTQGNAYATLAYSKVGVPLWTTSTSVLKSTTLPQPWRWTPMAMSSSQAYPPGAFLQNRISRRWLIQARVRDSGRIAGSMRSV